MKCAENTCTVEATHAPKICVPATGYPRDEARALVAIMGVGLCEKHCAEFPGRDQFFNKGTRKPWRTIYRLLAKSAGSDVPPDFKRAWVVCVLLTSAEYLALEKAQAGSVH